MPLDPEPVATHLHRLLGGLHPLPGEHNIGEPCDNPRGAAAQSPDGIALVCTAQWGWVQWV